jgi:hypothetical protein
MASTVLRSMARAVALNETACGGVARIRMDPVKSQLGKTTSGQIQGNAEGSP